MMIIRQHQQMGSAATRTPMPLPHQVVEQGDDIYARDTTTIQHKFIEARFITEANTDRDSYSMGHGLIGPAIQTPR